MFKVLLSKYVEVCEKLLAFHFKDLFCAVRGRGNGVAELIDSLHCAEPVGDEMGNSGGSLGGPVQQGFGGGVGRGRGFSC